MMMMYARDQTETYEEFSRTMIEQSFAYVHVLPLVGLDHPGMEPGQYGVGSMGQVQFQSHVITWIERFAQTVLFPGHSIVQRLDPYHLYDGGSVEGILALYIPKDQASAIQVLNHNNDSVRVPPPSNDPSCGLVFVPTRGHPINTRDGWCISFDLAINDYELDCITRLQCLLQGLCPRVPEQLVLARQCTRLRFATAMPFAKVLQCPSATRHPRSLTLWKAIFLVAACARRPCSKRVRSPEPDVEEQEQDTYVPSPSPPPPPPTPTPILTGSSNIVPSPVYCLPPSCSVSSSVSVSVPVSTSVSIPSKIESADLKAGSPSVSSLPLPSSPSSPSSPLLYVLENNEMDTRDEQEREHLDDGVHTPLPVNVSTVCPAEFATLLPSSPSHDDDANGDVKQLPSPSTNPSTTLVTTSQRRYSMQRWYEYEYPIDTVLAYKKYQPVIDDDHPIKLAYAFPGIDQASMSTRYPCVVTLVKLNEWSRETYEVFGASRLRQAIELVLRIHTKANTKSGDAYVATNALECTNVPVDVALDDGVPIEEVILRRRPKAAIRSMVIMTKKPEPSKMMIHAWHAGGQPYVVPRSPEQRPRRVDMTGLGIPKRRCGHQPPIDCSTDAGHYSHLYAQPKTLLVPDSLRQMIRRKIPFLKTLAFNQYTPEDDYFPTTITSSGDWLAEHHLEIARAAGQFLQNGGKSGTHKFPLECKFWSKRSAAMETMDEDGLTLTKFLVYYLELIEFFSRSGTILGDAIFFPHQRRQTADFILDVVFGRAESLARLFKETDNTAQCLWVFRKSI